MPNLVQIRPQGASGKMGEIQQKLFLFTGSYCLVDTSRGQPSLALLFSVIRYDTIRDAILTCARKPT